MTTFNDWIIPNTSSLDVVKSLLNLDKEELERRESGSFQIRQRIQYYKNIIEKEESRKTKNGA